MLCGCTPVATRAAALPEVVGDTGFYAEPGDVNDAARAITRALDNPDGRRARARISSRFPLTSRIEGIQGYLRSLAYG
jgi:glycosyltransferase involved in cell wall biosynthesis